MERSWGALGRVWGRSWAGLGAILGGLGLVLGWFWARLGRIWGGLGVVLGQFDRSLVWGFFLEAKKVPKAAKGSEERQREANMNKNKQRETKRKTEQQFQSISNFKKVVALPVPCSDRFMLELFFALFFLLFSSCFFVRFWEAKRVPKGSLLEAFWE